MVQSTRPHGGQEVPEEVGPSRELAADAHRPRYHFLPPANWMNDPNGLIQWRGRYHLFYQHNPFGPLWGNMHWGHAVSDDLVHWTHLPLALAPTPGSPDEDGCFSGCAVVDGGVPTLVYTGVRGRDQLPCLATSDDDDLRTWHKDPRNPVIPARPPGLDLVGFRDHAVWREDGVWYQLIGSGIAGVGGAALLYRSPDLRDWEYLGPLLVGDQDRTEPFHTGIMWECPDFFPLGEKHVLVVSAWDSTREHRLHHAAYMIGTYRDHRFVPETEGILDTGGHFYAPQTLLDDRGRRLMWGWLWEGRDNRALEEAGWAGVMSLPRVLSLRDDGALGIEPVPELALLRGAEHRLEEVALAADAEVPVAGVHGDCLEIVAEIAPGGASVAGLTVRRSPDGAEETAIVYDCRSGRLTLDCERSSLSVAVDRPVHGAALPLAPGEPLRLHLFLDRSVVEVFANGRARITDRIYPTRADSRGVRAFARGGRATLTAFNAWAMAPIWMAGG